MALRQADRDGLIYGISAGAIIFGRSLEWARMFDDAPTTFGPGLSLLGELSLLCHYSADDSEPLPIGALPMWGIPDRSGIHFTNQQHTIIGNPTYIAR